MGRCIARPGPFVRSFTLVAALIFSSCDLVDPRLPPDAVQFSPPAVYPRWWAMVESCSGVERLIDKLAWYVVPGAQTISVGNRHDFAGYWFERSNRIVLAGQSQLDGPIVRHEMLHAIIRNSGHPRESFLRRCAGVVSCGPECVAEAGLPAVADAATPRVTADALNLGLQLSHQVPRLAVDEGFFTVTVTARNPSAHAVVVVLAPRTGNSLGSTFSYDVRGPIGGRSGGDLAFDVEALMFSAGETKRHVYDFRVGYGPERGSFPPGDYMIRGGYDHVWTEPRSVTLAP